MGGEVEQERGRERPTGGTRPLHGGRWRNNGGDGNWKERGEPIGGQGPRRVVEVVVVVGGGGGGGKEVVGMVVRIEVVSGW